MAIQYYLSLGRVDGQINYRTLYNGLLINHYKLFPRVFKGMRRIFGSPINGIKQDTN